MPPKKKTRNRRSTRNSRLAVASGARERADALRKRAADLTADIHARDWEAVAAQLADSLGPRFDPRRIAEYQKLLPPIIAKAFPELDRTAVVGAVDEVLRRYKTPIDWTRIICLLLSWLPGSWSKVANNPGFSASTMLLLTDGTVMCQEQGGLRWKKLTPDANGSYINGTWTDLAPMHNTRRYYASAVLKDGRVFVSGGEYSDAGGETNVTEIYDPVTDVWTQLTPPTGWSSVGDAPCAVLPDGRVLLGDIYGTRTIIFDPVTETWTAGPTKGAASSEESWVLLPDETVVTVRCNSSKRADKYVAASNTWVGGGTLPVGIIEISSSEIGAGVLRNDGRAFFAGANGHTALYAAPAVASDPGSWTQGPDFPNDPLGQTVGCKDAPACLMTNGKILIAAGPVDGSHWLSPTYFFEYNGASLNRVSDPVNSTGVPYIGRMLLLPTGQILFAAQTGEVYAYSYFGCPDSCWRPTITTYPTVVRPLRSYTIEGHRFNGMSQAVGYGDDAAASTNYPLVRIRNKASGHVRYCRTFEHSTMGVATGSAPTSTNFHVPWDIELGASEICVVANGISSPCCPLTVAPFWFPWPVFDDVAVAWLIGSLADGPLWALGPRGPVPVDPWGPLYVKQAAAARKEILAGVRSLQRLGAKLDGLRARAAAAVRLAPDETSEETSEQA